MDLLREPSILITVLVSALWYWRGSRRPGLRAVGRPRRRVVPWRGLCFGSGLVTIVIALDSPVERLADDLFWAHMLQHVLLMMVAAPLIVLGAPWMPFWRPLPLRLRRSLARAVVKGPRLAWLRRGAGVVAAPVPAWILFNADLGAWHLPQAYDLTLRNGGVHYAEHVSFLLLGMLHSGGSSTRQQALQRAGSWPSSWRLRPRRCIRHNTSVIRVSQRFRISSSPPA